MVYCASETCRCYKTGKRSGKVLLWKLEVSLLKGEFYAALRLEKDSDGNPPANYCHFPEYDEHYFRGLTAEEQVIKFVKGYQRIQWQKVYERNEPLDYHIYARAAAAIEGLDRLSPEQLQALTGGYRIRKKSKPEEDTSTHRKKKRESIWD